MPARSLLARGRFIEIVEAMLAPAKTDDAWASGIVDLTPTLFPTAALVNVQVVEHDLDGRSRRCALAVPEVPTRALLERTIAERHPICPAGLSWVEGEAAVLALVAHPVPGVIVAIGAVYEEKIALQANERRALHQLALHLDAAHRLRLRPSSVVAVLSENGKVLSREPSAPADGLMTEQVARIHRARSRAHRSDGEGLALWTSLLNGQVSLVPRSVGSRTEYLVLDNPIPNHSYRALSQQESSALVLSSQGIPNKLVAYGLGLSPSVVSAHLQSAASKVGLASRVELLRIAALLTRDERSAMNDAVLTAAEQDILALLERGLSNQSIAALRSRSVRTIANQVASLLRKTGAQSRRELMVRAARKQASTAAS